MSQKRKEGLVPEVPCTVEFHVDQIWACTGKTDNCFIAQSRTLAGLCIPGFEMQE